MRISPPPRHRLLDVAPAPRPLGLPPPVWMEPVRDSAGGPQPDLRVWRGWPVLAGSAASAVAASMQATPTAAAPLPVRERACALRRRERAPRARYEPEKNRSSAAWTAPSSRRGSRRAPPAAGAPGVR